jgi:predicted RND superfamily exporter protein
MILLRQTYSILTAVLGSMTIGIGSSTILIMERYPRNTRSPGTG